MSLRKSIEGLGPYPSLFLLALPAATVGADAAGRFGPFRFGIDDHGALQRPARLELKFSCLSKMEM